MTQALVIGLILGVATGLSPRPALLLLVGEAVRSGWRSGLASLAGSLIGDGLLAAGLVAVTFLLQQMGPVALVATELIAAVGLFYLTYQMGISLPRVASVTVEDVAKRVSLGEWPGLAGIRRGILASLSNSLSWALWILVGTAIVLSLPAQTAAVPWLIGGWLTATLLTEAGVLLAAGWGALHLDSSLLRGVTVFALAVFWLSGISLLTTAVRGFAALWLH